MGQRINAIRKRNVGLSNTKTIIRREIKKATTAPVASVAVSVAVPLNYTSTGGSGGNEDQTSSPILHLAGTANQIQVNGGSDLLAADAIYDTTLGALRAHYAAYDGTPGVTATTGGLSFDDGLYTGGALTTNGKTIAIVGTTVTQHFTNGVLTSVTLNADGSEVTPASTPA